MVGVVCWLACMFCWLVSWFVGLYIVCLLGGFDVQVVVLLDGFAVGYVVCVVGCWFWLCVCLLVYVDYFSLLFRCCGLGLLIGSCRVMLFV